MSLFKRKQSNKAPAITEAMQQEASQKPGGYVYCIDEYYAKDGVDGAIPREGIIGAYPVDQNGIIIPEFAFNPHYVKPA